MKISRLIAIISVALLHISIAKGQDHQRDYPEPVAECFDIRGRVMLSNGTPSVRIWVIGTKRILGVHELYDPTGSEKPLIPADVERLLSDHQSQIFGDFTVCPLTQQKQGEMQMVFIKSAKNLVSRVQR